MGFVAATEKGMCFWAGFWVKRMLVLGVFGFGGAEVRGYLGRLEGRDGYMIDGFCSHCWWVVVGLDLDI